MAHSLQKALDHFIKVHDDFLIGWQHAMETGDTSALEIMSEDYYVTFFTGNAEKPSVFNRTEAVEGMRQSVSALSGARKQFNNRIIRMRNAEHAVVFYEQVIVQDGKELSKLFTIENWRYRDTRWEILREVAEHI